MKTPWLSMAEWHKQEKEQAHGGIDWTGLTLYEW